MLAGVGGLGGACSDGQRLELVAGVPEDGRVASLVPKFILRYFGVNSLDVSLKYTLILNLASVVSNI